MSLMLQDKTIVITGACGALGKASVKLFLEKGARIAAVDRKDPREHPFFAEMQALYSQKRLIGIQADLVDESQVAEVFAQIRNVFGRLDGSFHNAYAQLHRLIVDYTLDEWDTIVRGTLTSTFLVCKHAVKFMIESGDGGAIVNTSSVLSQMPQAKSSAYCAAKAAINQFTRVLAKENAEHRIRANCLLPGDFKEKYDELSEKAMESMRINTLAGRTGKPAEIAEFAAFLLSDSAAYVTASLHTIDGGYRL